MRRALESLCRLLLRIFFRRIELDGLGSVPAAGPVILVANHPSTLVDPILLLAFSPRPASFLAKEPVFRIPVIGAAARALGSIPVYRAMDGADPRRNAATFTAARALLARGGALALFPEGTSHDDPRMKPLKSGAARIALGAASSGERLPLAIVPVGLVFTDKRTFRSEVLVAFGAPIAVDPVELGPRGEPPPPQVRALTQRIQEGLDQLVLQAESAGALALAAGAERILTEGEPASLAGQVQVRQRLLAGRAWLAVHDPGRLASLERRMAAHLRLLDAVRLGRPEQLAVHPAEAAGRAVAWLLLAPLAGAGVLLHAPAWTLVDALAHRLARGDQSMEATLKLGLGLVCYPATWLAAGLLVGLRFGAGAGLLAGACGPLLAAAAVALDERSEAIRTLVRAAGLALGHRGALERLRADREALRAELLAAADLVPDPAGPR